MTVLLTKSIPKTRPADPALDFEVLRAEGIRHLENLATEIWTDYNAHDPGITMLELLCYAITDLGYRTQMLPIEDLMAANANAPKAWFEAAEILPGAPVTELDFRKILIDVEGIRNAWIVRPDAPEIPVYHTGIVFPTLTKDGINLDLELFTAFLKEKGLSETGVDLKKLMPEIQAHFDKKLKISELQPFLKYTKRATPEQIRASAVESLFKKMDGSLDPLAAPNIAGTAIELLGNFAAANFSTAIPVPTELVASEKAVADFFQKITNLDDFRAKAVADSAMPGAGFNWTALLQPNSASVIPFDFIEKQLNGQAVPNDLAVLNKHFTAAFYQISWENVVSAYPIWAGLGIGLTQPGTTFLTPEAKLLSDYLDNPPVPGDFDDKKTEFQHFVKTFKSLTDFRKKAVESFDWKTRLKKGKGLPNIVLITKKLDGLATTSELDTLKEAFEDSFDEITWNKVAGEQQLWKNLDPNFLKDEKDPKLGLGEKAKILFDYLENRPVPAEFFGKSGEFLAFIHQFSSLVAFKKVAVINYDWAKFLWPVGTVDPVLITKKLDGMATAQELANLEQIFLPAFDKITWQTVADAQKLWADLNIANFTDTPAGQPFKLSAQAQNLFDFQKKWQLIEVFWPKLTATFVAIDKISSNKTLQLDVISHAHFLAENLAAVEWAEVSATQRFELIFKPRPGFELPKLDFIQLATDVLTYEPTDPNAPLDPVTQYFEEHFCELGLHRLTFLEGTDAGRMRPLALNGIYQILLDLENDLDPANPAEAGPVIEAALDRLHADRALCEDFLRPIVVQERPIEICIHLEIDPAADELEVAAQAVWKLQNHLAPAPCFRGFGEIKALLRARNAQNSGENILNGPLLDNGFLDDLDVISTGRVVKYNHSDLVRIALATPGVLGVSDLKVNESPELDTAKLEVKSTYLVEVGDFEKIPAKAIIDVCASCFQIKKGEVQFKLDGCDLREKLDWLALLDATNLPDGRGANQYPDGFLRPDLTDYRSLQFDLPANYAVGDNYVPKNAPVGRQAKARHLQAYLFFFDQILASYLGQLGQLRRLLVVDQDADGATRQLPPLFDLPGIRELIEENARFVAEPTDWILIVDDAQVAAADRDAMKVLLKTWMTGGAIAFPGFGKFRKALRQKLFRPTPANAAQAPLDLFETYGYLFDNFFWKKYTADPNNNHVTALCEIAEDPSTRQTRKNAALDHLIARFGEQFSTYVVTLLRPDAEPEDNPWRQTFDEFLKKKADFLRNLARLGSERGKAYNYRQFDKALDKSQVWNASNISGLQRRVASLTGIELREKNSSLIADPPYRLDLVQVSTKKGSGHWRIRLRVRPESVFFKNENPDPALPIMVSPPFATKNAAQAALNKLATHISEADHETKKDDDLKKWVATISIDGELMLLSDEMSKDEARDHQELVKELVKSAAHEIEGCHIVEHLLLRPNDLKDHLLQLHLGCIPEETPADPYSFWISVILPKNTVRFSNPDFCRFFEQTFRRETPAHIAVRFCYLGKEDLYLFEEAFYRWMFEKARCRPDECNVTEAANTLIDMLNRLNCSCACTGHEAEEGCCEKEAPVPVVRPKPVDQTKPDVLPQSDVFKP